MRRSCDRDAVAAEAVDHQPAHCAGPGGDRQAGHAGPRIGSVQLDEQDRIVADGQCVGAGPRLGIAVDDHRVGDRGQGRGRG